MANWANNVFSVSAGADHGSTIYGLTFTKGLNCLHPHKKINLLYCIITNCDDGIDFEGGSGGTWQHNIVENCVDDGFDLDNDVLDVVCEHNIFRNNGEDGIEIRLDPFSGSPLVLLFRHNQFINNGDDGIQLIEEDGETDRTFYIENNTFCGNKVGIGMKGGSDSIEDFEGYGIEETIYLFNNTFDGNDHGITGGHQVLAVNNIFSNNDVGAKNVDEGSMIAYSDFFNNNTNTISCNLDNPTLLFVDPLFNTDKTLMNGSPCIDAGVDSYTWDGDPVNNIPAIGFSGTAPDMGAYENATAGCTLPEYAATAVCVGGNNSQFFIDVNLTGGSGTNYTISNNINGSTWSITIGNTVQVGPFANNANVDITVEDDNSALCSVTKGAFFNDCSGSCPGPVFTANEVCLATDGSNYYIDLTVTAGQGINYTISNSLNGTTVSAELDSMVQIGPFQNNVSVDITATDDANGNCSSIETNLSEDCPCVNPALTVVPVCNPGETENFYIDVTIFSGSGASYLVTNSHNGNSIIVNVGNTGQIGPFPNNTTVDVTVADTGNGSCTVVTNGILLDCNLMTISSQVDPNTSSDDAEEDEGSMNLTSGDLDLNDDRIVGVRFNNIAVPQGATIVNADIQFVADKTSDNSSPVSIIRAEAADNALTFMSDDDDISDRTQTSASVTWNMPQWIEDDAGPDQQTPEINTLIQEVTDRAGWVSGNSIVVIFTTSGGERAAKSVDDGGGSGNGAVLSITFTPPVSPLPVELADFKAREKGCTAVELEWMTLSETNNDYFEIQRSSNGTDFNTLSRITGQGNATEKTYYQYMDEGLERGGYYYRLLQMDLDGQSTPSQVIYIEKECSLQQYEIFPNPARDAVILNAAFPNAKNAELNIYNQAGLLVQQITLSDALDAGVLNHKIDISTFPSGVYAFVLLIDGKTMEMKKVLKQ